MRNSQSLDPFDAQRRQKLLDSIQELEKEYHSIENRLIDDEVDRNLHQKLDNRLEVLSNELSNLLDKYKAGLPIASIGRCPFCKSLFRSSIDTFGLDGLWWNYDAPTRRDDEETCSHFLVLDGAIKLSKKVEFIPFNAVIGPDVPFVIPRIINGEGVIAVVTSIRIGQHYAYPISYYAEPVPYALELVNTWGTSYYVSKGPEVDDDGDHVAGWSESPCLEEDYDFELGPWIRRGKLFWIKPDDPDLELQTDLIGCPYLNLNGHQKIQYLSFDEVTIDDEDDNE
jgi:hypothetical protein